MVYNLDGRESRTWRVREFDCLKTKKTRWIKSIKQDCRAYLTLCRVSSLDLGFLQLFSQVDSPSPSFLTLSVSSHPRGCDTPPVRVVPPGPDQDTPHVATSPFTTDYTPQLRVHPIRPTGASLTGPYPRPGLFPLRLQVYPIPRPYPSVSVCPTPPTHRWPCEGPPYNLGCFPFLLTSCPSPGRVYPIVRRHVPTTPDLNTHPRVYPTSPVGVPTSCTSHYSRHDSDSLPDVLVSLATVSSPTNLLIHHS